MAPQIEIAIPNTSVLDTPKPHTVYNISLRLPLRSYSLQKRYSEFSTLHNSLSSEAGAPPPAALPGKSWFSNTVSSPELAEERRTGLQSYLQIINQSPDERWRNTSAWRIFLNLPSTTNASRSGTTANLHAALGRNGAPTTDPLIWLDQHRDLKAQLQEVRIILTRRDQAASSQAQHEASTQAKKLLVKAGGIIFSLESGLKELGSTRRAGEKLGEGEMRRRRDLVAAAKKERDGLENLLSAMAAKAALDRTVASVQSKNELLNTANDGDVRNSSVGRPGRPVGGGRVLGKETDKTQALDNQGVAQLQRQMMQEQDEDVDILHSAVVRQGEVARQMQAELAIQDDLLRLFNEDVDRHQGKLDVARKRIGKLS